MRESRIDILRTVGLIAIVLAHTNAPGFIQKIRSFDVPLIVIASGWSFRLSFKADSYWHYVKNRVLRLVVPVWIFLAFYFSFSMLLYRVFDHKYIYSAGDIVSSFCLVGGLGYLWIIRVLLIIAALSPLIMWSYQRLGVAKFLALVFGVYIFCQAFIVATQDIEGPVARKILDDIIFLGIPYACVFCVGIWIQGASTFSVSILTLSSLAILVLPFLLYLFPDFYGGTLYPLTDSIKPIDIRAFKYPPRTYYLAYSLLISGLLIILSRHIRFPRGRFSQAICFVSTNSLWIYLWHIFTKFIWVRLSRTFFDHPVGWEYMFSFVFFGATIITCIQSSAVGIMEKRSYFHRFPYFLFKYLR